jgi:hypothetical protein
VGVAEWSAVATLRHRLRERCQSGTTSRLRNALVKFDPKTEDFQTWPFTGDGDIVRNMDVTAGGNVVTANSLVNQVGFVEIR